jgi:hypothetical protein
MFEGMGVVKAYTPIVPNILYMGTKDTILGGTSLSLMIKIYPDGMLTPTLNKLVKGAEVSVPKYTIHLKFDSGLWQRSHSLCVSCVAVNS